MATVMVGVGPPSIVEACGIGIGKGWSRVFELGDAVGPPRLTSAEALRR